MKTCCLYLLSIIIVASATISCKKDDGTVPVTPVDQKPKVGTIWTYNYNWYNSLGGPTQSKVIYHKAVSEETLGGEKWLKIVDVETDTLVYYLNTKADGLYQYTNNNAYLLCKYPAVVNDTYNTFNGGSAETFTVKKVNDTIITAIGNIASNYYEGVKNAEIIDLIWYNKNTWMVWKHLYIRVGVPPVTQYYLKSQMYIVNIVY